MTRPKKQYFFSKKFRFSFLRPEKRAQKAPAASKERTAPGRKQGKLQLCFGEALELRSAVGAADSRMRAGAKRLRGLSDLMLCDPLAHLLGDGLDGAVVERHLQAGGLAQLGVAGRAGTASYTELCETAGLQVPFNDGSIKAIAQQMSQWIAEHQV